VPSLKPGIHGGASLREQYDRVDNLLNIKHHPAVALSLIGRIFGVSNDTIKAHAKQYLAQKSLHRKPGRAANLSTEKHEDLLSYITETIPTATHAHRR
jgi:hypothetical protein